MRISDWSSDECSSDLVGRDRLFLGKTMEIMRAAGLWPRPRQAAAAERLRADAGADLVAVDIDVADLRARRDMRRGAVDARLAPQRQPIDRGVDPIGRASCREWVFQYVSISVVAESLKKKTTQ